MKKQILGCGVLLLALGASTGCSVPEGCGPELDYDCVAAVRVGDVEYTSLELIARRPGQQPAKTGEALGDCGGERTCGSERETLPSEWAAVELYRVPGFAMADVVARPAEPKGMHVYVRDDLGAQQTRQLGRQIGRLSIAGEW